MKPLPLLEPEYKKYPGKYDVGWDVMSRLRWLGRLMVAALLACGVLYWASRTEAVKLPDGVRKETLHLILAGRNVAVTFYYPANRDKAPLVLIAHGFARSKRYMAWWGAELAGEGFLAAVPTLPALAEHDLNARVLCELLEQLRQGRVRLKVKPGPQVALVGFSMGGFTTLVVAAKQPVDAWVGLDPVITDRSQEIKDPGIPCAILRAEPGAWNWNGNARSLAAALHGPKLLLKVRSATHLDAESPTDALGQSLCGRSDPVRHAVFKRYAIAFLKSTILGDPEAGRILDGAVKDEALAETSLTGLSR
jgi:dienelactone hydrolase